MPIVVGLDFEYPEASRARSFGARKPRALVLLIDSDGGSARRYVPARVARALEKDEPSLPADLEKVDEALGTMSRTICMTVLTEMLSRRDHSIHEAQEKLDRYGFDADTISMTIDRGVSLKFLNDQRFATYFIESRKRRGWGRRKIELELKRKGVDLEGLPGYPDDFYSAEDDSERAMELLGRKRVPESRAYEKLVRFLMSKGFDYSTAASAVKQKLDSERC